MVELLLAAQLLIDSPFRPEPRVCQQWRTEIDTACVEAVKSKNPELFHYCWAWLKKRRCNRKCEFDFRNDLGL